MSDSSSDGEFLSESTLKSTFSKAPPLFFDGEHWLEEETDGLEGNVGAEVHIKLS